MKMGEQSITPNKSGISNSDQSENTEHEMNSDNEDMSPEEFANLDSQLDELNSALDDIEQKNDDIHAKLLQLLHANREVRKQLKLDQEDRAVMETDSDVAKH
ncbi:uncharacterized protein [Leptinotarsa decemlineata]|uniref:uncharacterized protein n=1 Tax=Leptinotarsa decemlineata TaxID=7539 RepID=UPI003D309117